MGDAVPNYDYSGIGKAEALLVFSALAASPVSWLTNGILGSLTFWALTQVCTFLANKEVLILNVAVTDIQIIFQKGDYDASFDNAFKAINGNRDKLTPEQKAEIDAPVMAAFRAFGVFGQLRSSANPGASPGDNVAGQPGRVSGGHNNGGDNQGSGG